MRNPTAVRRRNSDARERIIKVFRAECAWTAREIHRQTRTENLATVYRNIRSLLAEGLVREVCLPGTEARFEKADTGHHAHLVCRLCRTAECVPCPIPARPGLSSKRAADGCEEHHLEFHGLCSNCR
jgi:Fe2+ or Zn2+ uptake regulation protein